jgi:DNA-binding transcriptional ArsR family regulator
MFVPIPSPSNADEVLARSLDALATASRLALIRELRTPKSLSEIRVGAVGDPDRPLSRQAVREHLERLMEIGVVLAREAARGYGETMEYSLNHQTLYALSEEFRGLARLRPTLEPALPTLSVGPGGDGSSAASSPALVLVKGLDEGRVFDLRPPPGAGSAHWIIGRRRGVQVALDFDPFVSSEQAVVEWDGRAHCLRDLPESRNGTLVNFRPLERGEARALAPGDVVGVGRSLLVFQSSG